MTDTPEILEECPKCEQPLAEKWMIRENLEPRVAKGLFCRRCGYTHFPQRPEECT